MTNRNEAGGYVPKLNVIVALNLKNPNAFPVFSAIPLLLPDPSSHGHHLSVSADAPAGEDPAPPDDRRHREGRGGALAAR